ncbi:hypothetical protein [Microbacterium dauci]|uniref:Uncharacterized protein n=1 Tax=Microbacterium dauci TaxID=3048008 RepID=A0ABT6ZEL8_9MICO|nr:hypothetical protein [Microbacterium sp. LX3-4]MDJ1114604.1 hypothetical protein [Microbacterium sp. LX3-4]
MTRPTRAVWLVDRNGASITEDVTGERFDALVDTLGGDDVEHASISLSDEDGWNLEVYANAISLENVEPGGDEIGTIRGADRATLRAIADEFLAGDFDALQGREWA